MKAPKNGEKTKKHVLRSFADFRQRFYPKPVEPETPELPDPEVVAGKLAKESLDRLQEALSAK